MKTIALIACCRRKAAERMPAHVLYQGQLFQQQLAYARQALQIDLTNIHILSAHYGLIRATTPIAPYELSLAEMTAVARRQWADEVWQQLQPHLATALPPVYVMAGKLYREPLTPKLENHQIAWLSPPPAGLGYGAQLQWYQNQLRKKDK
jgi:cytoplasmic iron level regulating protein YaaA (DUF328/UPF0246 family)